MMHPGQSDSLVELLLNTIRLSVPLAGGRGGNNFLCFSHGEYFYSLFQTTVNAELLRLLDATVPALLRAASCNPSMVRSLRVMNPRDDKVQGDVGLYSRAPTTMVERCA